MNPTQVELVQSTFAKVLPIAETAAELFYNRLFELDPSLRSLFRGDMKEQGKKLMTSLHVIVSSLKHLDRIMPGIQGLAVRHVSYGVKNSDYAVVGQALIDTLEKGLGDAFTSDVRDAWLAAYTTLANTMKAAVSASQAA
jgi:hemoglobin-like flavoprotein